VRQTDSIHAIRKTLRDVPAIFSHMKIQLELVPADTNSLGRREPPLAVAHFESKLSSILLRSCLENDDARHCQNSDDIVE